MIQLHSTSNTTTSLMQPTSAKLAEDGFFLGLSLLVIIFICLTVTPSLFDSDDPFQGFSFLFKSSNDILTNAKSLF